MALHADTVWEGRTAGNNNNGGGWHDAGGASADHSQQDAHNETWTNLSIAGTTLTDDDAGGKFTAAMLGNIINVLTAGRFEISTVTDADNVELDRAPGNDTGLTGYEGGAVADLEQIDNVVVAGNHVHVKAGTYTSGGAIAFTIGTSSVQIVVEGYNATRGDAPTGDNRPLLACGANGLNGGKYNLWKHFRITTSDPNGFYVDDYSIAVNCKCVNTTANAAGRAFIVDSGKLIDCEAVAASARGVFVVAYATIVFCHIHDSNEGIYCASAGHSFIGFNIIENIAAAGILGDGSSHVKVMHNTIDNCDKGVDFATDINWLIYNNQFTHNTTYGATADGLRPTNYLDYNNWHGNGDDVNNLTKGPHATANDPGYAGADDFSGVDDADAFGIRLGVG